MQSLSAIDALYNEGVQLSEFLANSREPSFRNYHDSQFRKTLLLAAASRFESEVVGAILDFVHERTTGDSQVVALVKARVIERQYHTLFKWERRNANHFFSLFGGDFKNYAESIVSADSQLNEAIAAFLELGDLRNQLVHRDFATMPLDKTVDEIYRLFKQAQIFVDRLPSLLRSEMMKL